MLQAIRDKTRGWIAYVIVAALAVPFASFGVYNYLTGGGNPAVAEVDGAEIKTNELNNAVQQQQQRLRRLLGDRYDPEAFDDATLRRQALERLITERLLDAYVQAHGLAGTDSMVVNQLRDTRAFQVGGEFSPERYREALRRSNIPVAEYENRLRRQGALDQLRDAVTSSVVVTDEELARVAAVQYQQRHVAWLRVAADAFADDVSLDDAAIQSYYESNQEAFRRPRQVKLAYVTLSPEKLAKDISISESELRQRYEETRDSRGTPERRRTSHILIELPEDAGDAAVEEARQRLLDLRERIRAGELTFAEAAQEVSEDPGSAKQGGELGVIRRGDMVEPFGEAAFALEEGGISDPVRTDFGMHLLRVSEVLEGETPPFEAVRDELRATMAREVASKQLFERANRLGNIAYENPGSLRPAADALGLAVRETGWIGPEGADEGIAAAEPVVEAAFSPELLQERRNSDVLVLEDEQRVVVRVTDSRPSTIRPLEAVRDQVVERLKQERAGERAAERAGELATAIREGAGLGGLADGDAVSLSDYGWIGRRAEDPPRTVLQAAFSLPAPSDGELAVDSVGLPEGDHGVVVVRGVRDGELVALSEEQRQQLREVLRQTDARSSVQNLIAVLREQADVTIYEERL